MTRDTETFIQHLAENVEPVRPFGRPWIRTGVWISVSILYVWVVLLMMVHWRGLPPITFDLRFIVEVFSGLAAGVAAAACAFASVIPGYNRKVLVGLVAPLAVWLGSLGDGCIQEWVRYGSQSLSLHHDLSCFPFIAFFGLVTCSCPRADAPAWGSADAAPNGGSRRLCSGGARQPRPTAYPSRRRQYRAIGLAYRRHPCAGGCGGRCGSLSAELALDHWRFAR